MRDKRGALVLLGAIVLLSPAVTGCEPTSEARLSRDVRHEADVLDPIDSAPDGVAPAETSGPTDDPVAAPCTACTVDGDCGEGLHCLKLGATRNCLAACRNDADCEPGWGCYPLTQTRDVCVPGAFDCAAACLTDGCPPGFACDQGRDSETFGQCVPALGLCAPCVYPWQCDDGLRCVMTPAGVRFCVAECMDDPASCPEWAHCREQDYWGGVGVMVCKPWHFWCCGPNCADEPCLEPCGGRLPHCHEGRCVQCRDDSHCSGTGETCDPETLRCVGGPCSDSPMTPYEHSDGHCVQCLEDAHCGRGSFFCEDYACGTYEECGPCAPPFPGCAPVNGAPTCVPCTEDAHCAEGGTCDLDTFECVYPGEDDGEED